MTAAAGLLFSMACAVLIEEVFVGSFFRLFFSPHAYRARVKAPVDFALGIIRGLEGRVGTSEGDLLGDDEPTQRMDELDVDQMRRAQAAEQSAFENSLARIERGIDHRVRALRSHT